MNENDYTLLEYMSIFAGVIITILWVAFSLAYQIPIQGMSAIFQVIIGATSFLFAIIFYFKKKIYVLEMRQLSKEAKPDGKMDSDTTQKLQ